MTDNTDLPNFSQRGFLASKGKVFLIPFKKSDPYKNDFEAEPGEIELSSGLKFSGEESTYTSHLDGTCDDMVSTPAPARVLFPKIPAPEISIAGVQVRLPPLRLTLEERIRTTTEVAASSEGIALFMKFLSGDTGGRSTDELENIKREVRQKAMQFMQDIDALAADRKCLLHSATVVYALRLRGGGHCHWSAPFTLCPNADNWGVELSNVQSTGTSIVFTMTLCALPWRPAFCLRGMEEHGGISIPFSKESMEEEAEAIDFFIRRSKHPDFEEEENSITTFTYRDDMPRLNSSGELVIPEQENIRTCRGVKISGAWKEKEIPEMYDPDEYLPATSIPMDSLPEEGVWMELEISSPNKGNEVEAIPDYEADISGEGELISSSDGSLRVINPHFAIPPARTEYSIFPSEENSENDGIADSSLFIRLMEKGACRWYPLPAKGWDFGRNPESVFHPLGEADLIAEQNNLNDGKIVHRCFSLMPLRNGGSRWSRRVSGLPEWKESPFNPESSLMPPDNFPLRREDTILFGTSETEGWYPSATRLHFHTSSSDLKTISLLSCNGNGFPSGSLIAYTSEDIRFLYPEDIDAGGRMTKGWKEGETTEGFRVGDYRHTLSIPSGGIFLCGGRLWKIEKKGCHPMGEIIAGSGKGLRLRYHFFAEIIEVCDDEGTILKFIDARTEKEIYTGDSSLEEFLYSSGIIGFYLPDELKEKENVGFFATRPFRIMENGPCSAEGKGGKDAVPLFFNILPSPPSPASYEEASLKCFTGVMESCDLITWRIHLSRGFETRIILPVAGMGAASRARWYRIIYLCEKGETIPNGVAITCR